MNKNKELLKKIGHEQGLSDAAVNMLAKIMRNESGGDTHAKAETSNATGLFQFVPGTWAKYGAKYGSIYDPEAQIRAAIDFTKNNEKALKNAGISNPSEGQFYLAHFAGAGGAIKVLNADGKTQISNLLSSDAIEDNSKVYLALNEEGKKGTKLYFKDFTANDLKVWANRKMDQPDGFETMTAEERAKWRKNNKVSDDTPDAFGDMVMTVLEIVSSIIKGIGSSLAGMYSGHAKSGSNVSPSASVASTTAKSGINPSA